MTVEEAVKVLSGRDRYDPVISAYRVLINRQATVYKDTLYGTDWSNREFANGKCLGFLEALEYFQGLHKAAITDRKEKEKKNETAD